MRYRRANSKGATYFFTVNLAERKRTLLTDEVDLLRTVMKEVMQQHPFKMDAIVILPDHLHTIWTLPEGDNDYPTRWRLIKSGFSRQLPKQERCSKSRQQQGERGIWQRRYWEHQIRDELDYEHHVDYIHYNPVKHGYVNKVKDWPYSSFHKYVENGLLDKYWSCEQNTSPNLEFGEIK